MKIKIDQCFSYLCAKENNWSLNKTPPKMDLMKMMGKVKEVQAKMKEAQENLVHLTSEGESGGGMVKAIVNGNKQLVKLEIDKDLAKPEDLEMLQDLVIAAVNKAITDVEEKARQYLQKQTEGILPNINIPGMDLGF